MNATVSDKSAILAEVCVALTNNQPRLAADVLQARYPFASLTNPGRRYSVRQACAVFARDGFIDRYSGARLVFPATLRLISKRLPQEFPFQTNWRMDACHVGYWELCPTIDHIAPVARGGADEERNWATTSMARNAAKANFLLEEVGWSLHPAGDINRWDGLTRWFVAQAKADPALLSDVYFRQWFAAASQIGQV